MNFFVRIFIKIKTLCNTFYYRSKFKKFGTNSYILKPLVLSGPENIIIEKNVLITHQVWLSATPLPGGNCLLQIGEGTNLGHYNHITASKEIIIEENVLTADRVYISDHLHGYEDITTPILKQPLIQKNNVRIGSGSWIGENACIIGVSIGKNCVIGANAVVTKDIPDYSVAVGIPAIIIKRYCINSQIWKKTNPAGDFIS